MKIIKRNQMVMFLFALILIAVGYINYNKNNKVSLETAGLIDSEQIAGIGDAKLVNSDNVVEQDSITNKEDISNELNNIDNETLPTNLAISDYFESSRLSREKMYSQMLETYQKIIESSSTSEEHKAISQSEITKIQNTKNSIMIAENLVRNKGVRDVIIFVNDYSISVIVDTETLGEAEIAQIQNIVVRELNAKVEDIHISKK